MSFIPNDNRIKNYLMGCINSKIYYYYLKNFINSTVNLQINDFRLFPIKFPNNENINEINNLIITILKAKRNNKKDVIKIKENDLNKLIYNLLLS